MSSRRGPDPHLLALMQRANRAMAAERTEKSLALSEEIVRWLDDIYGPDELIEVAITAHRRRVVDLRRLGRVDEALVAIDELLQRHRGSDHPDAREAVAVSLWNRMVLQQDRGQLDDEGTVAALQELIGYLRGVPGPERGRPLRRLLVEALCTLVDSFRWLDRHRSAIGAAEPLLHDRWLDDDEELGPLIACALRERGIAFEGLDRAGDATEAYRLVDERFGEAAAKEPNDADGGLRGEVLRALLGRGRGLDALNPDDEEKLTVCGRVVEIAGGSTVPWMRREVAKVMANAVAECLSLGRLDEGLAAADDVLRRFGADVLTARDAADEDAADEGADDESTGPDSICDSVDRALSTKIAILHRMARHEDEIAAWDELARRHRPWAASYFREQLTECSTDRARALAEEGRPDEALVLLDGLASRAGDPCPWETELATRIARAYLAAGDAIARAGRRDEAVLALAQVPRRFTRPWPPERECSTADAEADAEADAVEEPEDEAEERARRQIDDLVQVAQARILALQMAPLFG